MKYTIFIADLHLEASLPKLTELFMQFLDDYAKQADALYILGDLFKFWAGDDDTTPLHEQIKNKLREINAQGCKVYLMPGNRDFLLGAKFAMASGCTLLNDPYKTDIYGIPTALTHGDILCSKDYLMRIFRTLTRPKIFKNLFLSLPLGIRKNLASKTQKYSHRIKKQKAKNKMQPTEKAINQIMQNFNAQLLIHGHIHKRGIYKINPDRRLSQTATRIVLGTWQDLPKFALGDFLLIYADKSKNFKQIKSN